MASATQLDTRQRILEVAEQLVEQHGPGAVTLREIARQVGVSHGAPLRHFPSLNHIFTELAIDGFVGLYDHVREGRMAAGPDASTGEQLARGCDAYVRYAVERPGLFALMFRFEVLDQASDELAIRAFAAWNQLVDLVQAHRTNGWRDDVELQALAGACWSTVHGAAQLWSTQVLQRTTDSNDLDRQIDALITLAGLPTFDRSRSTTRVRARVRV